MLCMLGFWNQVHHLRMHVWFLEISFTWEGGIHMYIYVHLENIYSYWHETNPCYPNKQVTYTAFQFVYYGLWNSSIEIKNGTWMWLAI